MKQAKTTVQIMVWVTTIMIAILLTTWLPTNLEPFQRQAQTVNQDIANLQSLISQACISQSFSASYNPLTEQGALNINQSSVCIDADASTCATLPCQTTNNTVNLDNITRLTVTADENVTVS
jgi:hypothetical protein